ncbi:GTPase IMAP family member 5 [Gouania willdenowi]|uniref:GTPase IMAP family member 5-like n=1 Tax=Gouania willdenowi TaxID=441366 RepID=A0A8C5G311_GOUWI|nr:GTPase IMAP family member 5-like [Gouania willdenowi]XP_028311106.1 GTPase IMAP family member 5-like [Gouania willdenowi]
MSTSASLSEELRLLVLEGCGGHSGLSPTVCSILGLQDKPQGTEGLECSKQLLLNKQVAIVSSPAWFGSWCSPEERRKLISSFITLCRPGPHAFLLCVPVNQATDGEARALDVLEKLFGSSSVSSNTIVVFTQTEVLEEDEQLEDYLITWRKDLVELLERCGERYHILDTWKGEEEQRRAVDELLEKVEQVVSNTRNKHFSCSLLQEEEAVRSAGDLDLIVDSIFPSDSVSTSPTTPSFLWSLWETLTGWVRSLPSLVRREALLGALVGLFVGGPYGGVVGASVGSVATEVKRRKTQKNK